MSAYLINQSCVQTAGWGFDNNIFGAVVADGFKVIYRAVFLGKKVVFTVEIQITGWVRKLSKQKSVK